MIPQLINTMAKGDSITGKILNDIINNDIKRNKEKITLSFRSIHEYKIVKSKQIKYGYKFR